MTFRNLTTAAALVALSATPALAAEGGNLPRVVNFAIVAGALFFALRKPLSGYLSARTDEIRAALEGAREKMERAEAERRQAQELLGSLDAEVERAKGEAKRAAEGERARILKAATAEAERIKEIARKEIDAEVEAGRRRLLAKAAELSVSLAHEKLEKTMTPDDQARLIDRSIALLGKPS